MRWLLAALLAVPLLARAWPSAAQGLNAKAAAESLFQDGRRLMTEGNVEEACRKFDESQRLVPKLGTLLNLATCHEQQGRTATAWAEFTEAANRAARDEEEDRVAYARARLAALEPRLSMLTIEVARPDGDLTVHVGSESLGRGAWGTPVKVDPGDVVVRAERPGTAGWSQVVQIPGGPADVRVRVPELERPSDATGVISPPRAKRRQPPALRSSSSYGDLQRTSGWVTAGAGAVGIGVGTYFGVRTFQLKDESMKHCQGELCDRQGVDLRDSAHTSAVVSTLSIGLGAAAVVGGIVLLATAGPTHVGVAATASAGRLSVGGAF